MIGASGVLVAEVILLLARGVPFIISDALGIEASIISNYTLNKWWTFKDSSPYLPGLIKYHATSLIGVSANYVTGNALHYLLGVSVFIAYIIGVVVGFLANYVLSSCLVFHSCE